MRIKIQMNHIVYQRIDCKLNLLDFCSRFFFYLFLGNWWIAQCWLIITKFDAHPLFFLFLSTLTARSKTQIYCNDLMKNLHLVENVSRLLFYKIQRIISSSIDQGFSLITQHELTKSPQSTQNPMLCWIHVCVRF